VDHLLPVRRTVRRMGSARAERGREGMGDGADDVAARAGRRCAVLQRGALVLQRGALVLQRGALVLQRGALVLQRGALVLQRGALRFPWANWVEMRREGSAKAVRERLAPQPEDVAALDLDVHFRDQVLYHVAQVPAARRGVRTYDTPQPYPRGIVAMLQAKSPQRRSHSGSYART
jgi:hypothetical protein